MTDPPVPLRRQILVVDDVPANLLAVEAALVPLQRSVVTALSGREALARLLDTDFSLVLLDVQMPDMDGYETAHWIRKRERTRHLPIIFLTAHNYDHAAVLRAYQLGAVDFLFKPIEPDILRAKAEVFLSLQERTDELAAASMQHAFDEERRRFTAAAFRREIEREQAAGVELARLNQGLADNDRSKNEFLAILAHELRNPLAPIRTALDLIKLRPERAVEAATLEMLDRQLGVLSRLVEDLLDISRITAHKIELRPEPMDLRDAVALAVATASPVIETNHHALTIASPADPVAIVGDHVRLVQVVSNLLNNAARYTEPGGAIRIACGITEQRAFVEITDSGIGIPPELVDTIFEMFVQERVRSDGSGGLGLGLALARHLVELHRGVIHASSPGRGLGSTFRIELPSAGSSRGPARPQAHARPAATRGFARRPARGPRRRQRRRARPPREPPRRARPQRPDGGRWPDGPRAHPRRPAGCRADRSRPARDGRLRARQRAPRRLPRSRHAPDRAHRLRRRRAQGAHEGRRVPRAPREARERGRDPRGATSPAGRDTAGRSSGSRPRRAAGDRVEEHTQRAHERRHDAPVAEPLGHGEQPLDHQER